MPLKFERDEVGTSTSFRKKLSTSSPAPPD